MWATCICWPANHLWPSRAPRVWQVPRQYRYLLPTLAGQAAGGGVYSSSSARLAIPEVVDRPCWNRVESAYWSGDFQKIFFLFDPSLTSGMSVVLMWGHCLRHRPYIKQHMSAGRVAHRKRLRHWPPHLTTPCMRVELMVSQRRRQRANIKKTFFEKLMNIQYLNLPPYPNRWMVWLIQQGLAWRPRCVKTCCQEDEFTRLPTQGSLLPRS